MKILIHATALVVVAGIGACGTDVDDRPRTTQFITESVLGPSCGKAECHSTFAAAEGYVLDTPHGVDTTLRYQLANEGRQSALISDLPDMQPLSAILNSKSNASYTPMPYDAPMPEADAQLVIEWLSLGAPGSCRDRADAFCLAAPHTVTVTCGDADQFVFTTGTCTL